jgi:hypothetical protein
VSFTITEAVWNEKYAFHLLHPQAREGDMEARADQLAADKVALLTAQEELKAEVAEKVGLLDEFEARFHRQYKWVQWAEMAVGARS